MQSYVYIYYIFLLFNFPHIQWSLAAMLGCDNNSMAWLDFGEGSEWDNDNSVSLLTALSQVV